MRPLFAFTIALLLLASCKKEEKIIITDPPPAYGPSDSVSILLGIVHRTALCTDSFMLSSNFAGTAQLLLEYQEYDNCRFPGSAVRKRFVYEGPRVYIIDSTSGQTTTDTLITDPARRILEWRNTVGGSVLRFQYDANGQLLRTVSSSSSGSSDTTTATFVNGNLTSLAGSNGDTTRYTYYPNKRVPASGYFTQQGLRFGSAYYVRNTHLIKTASFNGSIISYTYGYDWVGNITTKIATPESNPAQSDTTFYRYTYPVQ